MADLGRQSERPASPLAPVELRAGGNCAGTDKSDLPCPGHGDRLVDGNWYCHIHDPEGSFQKNLLRSRDVPGQMTFDELISDDNAGDALFTPPDKAQLHEANKRIKKWTPPQL